jgi:hypothetical protein
VNDDRVAIAPRRVTIAGCAAMTAREPVAVASAVAVAAPARVGAVGWLSPALSAERRRRARDRAGGRGEGDGEPYGDGQASEGDGRGSGSRECHERRIDSSPRMLEW